MVATITDGYIFGATETVTSAKLQTQFTSALIASVSNNETDSVSRFMTNVAALPTSGLVGGMLDYLNTQDILFMRQASLAEWGAIPFCLRLTNNSGGSVASGDVVVIDPTLAKAFTTTTTANVFGTIGVVVDATIAGGAIGAVQFLGTALVNVNASTAVGDFLATSTVAKKALNSATAFNNTFGRALTASATQVLAQLGGVATSKGFVVNQQVFTSGGTFTASVTGQHKITVIGGGGGGGDTTAATQGGSGGGAGATAIYWASLTSGTGYTVTVGAAGTAGNTSPNAGGAGGNSTFVNGATTVTANGGAGGALSGVKSTGGTATNGTINIGGGDGFLGTAGASSIGGTGGASSMGGGGAGGGPGAVVGANGVAYGSGGGGSGNNTVNAGAGAGGIVIVEWIG